MEVAAVLNPAKLLVLRRELFDGILLTHELGQRRIAGTLAGRRRALASDAEQGAHVPLADLGIVLGASGRNRGVGRPLGRVRHAVVAVDELPVLGREARDVDLALVEGPPDDREVPGEILIGPFHRARAREIGVPRSADVGGLAGNAILTRLQRTARNDEARLRGLDRLHGSRERVEALGLAADRDRADGFEGGRHRCLRS